MGFYDTFHLIDPLNCFVCSSTPDDDVGSNVKEYDVQIGGSEVRIECAHDGKGGIKAFQTKDLDPCMANYPFPGVFDAIYFGSSDDFSISGLEICNSCDASYDAVINFQKVQNFFKTTSIQLTCSEEIESWKMQTNKHYDLRLADKNISIVPDFSVCADTYRRRTAELAGKESHLKSIIESIVHPEVPTSRISETLASRLDVPFPEGSDKFCDAFLKHKFQMLRNRLCSDSLTYSLAYLLKHEPGNAELLANELDCGSEGFLFQVKVLQRIRDIDDYLIHLS